MQAHVSVLTTEHTTPYVDKNRSVKLDKTFISVMTLFFVQVFRESIKQNLRWRTNLA